MSRPVPPSTPPVGQSPKAAWFAAIVLTLVTFATYWNSLSVPFFFDDPIGILENPTIRKLGDIGQVLSPPRNGSGVTGRPIVNLSLAINYALGGTSVRGYHVANILFHASAGLLLFGIVRRTLITSPRLQPFKLVALPFAFSVAALWLLHPLQTESVTGVIQRTELLVGLFYLLTLYCFIRAVEQPSGMWRFAAIASCLIGMASKEVMVSAPLLVLLYDRTFLAGTFAEAWSKRSRLYLGLAATWLLLALLLVSMGGTRGEVGGFNIGATWWSYALKQCEAIILYLRLTIWPNPLVVFYGTDVVTNPLEVWWQLLVLVALVCGTFHAVGKNTVTGFCAMWFFAILAPSSSVVPLVSQTVSEHRMYLSLAAPLGLFMAALFILVPRFALTASLSAAVALGVISARRNSDYQTNLSIWTDTVAKAPHNARARVNLGAALSARGDATAARRQYEIAVRQDPLLPEALNNLGTLYLDAKEVGKAIEVCQAALRLQPKFALAHNNLGTALIQAGRAAEGISHLQTALQLKPDLAEAHCNLGPALLAIGRGDEALAHAETAIRLKPQFALAHFNLSTVLLARNETARAVAALEAAVQLRPGYAEAHSNLGSLYYRAGDAAKAVPQFQAAVLAKPDYAEARNNLASALFQTGKVEQAVEEYRAVIRLQPSYAEAHFNLGLVLSRLGRNNEAIAAYSEAYRLRPDDERAKSELARLQTIQSGAQRR